MTRHRSRKGSSAKGAARVASIHASSAMNARHVAAAEELSKGAKELERVVKQFGNCSRAQVAGRVAEVHHTATLNADLRLAGRSDVHARTTASLGLPTASADIVVFKHGKKIAAAQVKYHRNAARSAVAVAKERYQGQQRILPKEQVRLAKCLLKRSSQRKMLSNPKKGLIRDEAAQEVAASFKVEGRQSEPLSSRGSRKLARQPSALSRKALATELAGAIKHGALSGFAARAALSGFQNVSDYREGKVRGQDAALSIAKDGLVGATEGATMAAISTVAKKGLVKVGLKSLSKSAAPATIAVAGIEVAKMDSRR